MKNLATIASRPQIFMLFHASINLKLKKSNLHKDLFLLLNIIPNISKYFLYLYTSKFSIIIKIRSLAISNEKKLYRRLINRNFVSYNLFLSFERIMPSNEPVMFSMKKSKLLICSLFIGNLRCSTRKKEGRLPLPPSLHGSH